MPQTNSPTQTMERLVAWRSKKAPCPLVWLAVAGARDADPHEQVQQHHEQPDTRPPRRPSPPCRFRP